jgi:hypothetical protein
MWHRTTHSGGSTPLRWFDVVRLVDATRTGARERS